MFLAFQTLAFAAGSSFNHHDVNPLIRVIPPALVRFFAGPYVAGDSLSAAMQAAVDVWRQRGVHATLDLLAEDIHSEDAVQRNLDTYLAMVDAVHADDRFGSDAAKPTLSLKPSSYTTDPLDRGGAAETSRAALFQIADRAKEKGVGLTIDMEGRDWTDFTLDVLSDLHRAGYTDVGAVLQTRLNRTEHDLDRLPPGCRVRLVIGIYGEPSTVATTDKRQMKERLLTYSRTLLQRGHYVELGTHDERFVRRFVEEVVPAAGVGLEAFELQMLYGVPRNKLLGEMVGGGIKGRLYIPFALSWPMAVAYLRRRLDEYPTMMFLVLKNLLLRR